MIRREMIVREEVYNEGGPNENSRIYVSLEAEARTAWQRRGPARERDGIMICMHNVTMKAIFVC